MEITRVIGNPLTEQEQASVNGIYKKLESYHKEELAEYRRANQDTEASEESKRREHSRVMANVLKKVDGQDDIVKRMTLAALWKIHHEKLYDGEGNRSLSEFIQANKIYFHNADYMLRLARGVEVVLEYVHQRYEDHNPIMIRQGDEDVPVSVELFIARPGYVTKLGQFHYQFSQLPEGEKQDEFVGMLATGSKSEIHNYVKDLNEKQEVEAVLGKIHGSIKRDKDKIDLVLRVTEEQLEYIKRSIKILELDGV